MRTFKAPRLSALELRVKMTKSCGSQQQNQSLWCRGPISYASTLWYYIRLCGTRHRGPTPSGCFRRSACRHDSRKQKEAEEIAAREEAEKAKDKRAQMVLEVNDLCRRKQILAD